MYYLLVGYAGFTLFFLYDINEICSLTKLFRYAFFAGFALVSGSTVCIAAAALPLTVPAPRVIVFGVCTALSVALLIYSLFFALPFGGTYKSAERRTLFDRGLYALCRHPGFIFFVLAYGFLWLMSDNPVMLTAFWSYSALNFLYILAQDLIFFPRMFDGYDKYRRRVPFILPTVSSIKQCFSYFSRNTKESRKMTPDGSRADSSGPVPSEFRKQGSN